MCCYWESRAPAVRRTEPLSTEWFTREDRQKETERDRHSQKETERDRPRGLRERISEKRRTDKERGKWKEERRRGKSYQVSKRTWKWGS